VPLLLRTLPCLPHQWLLDRNPRSESWQLSLETRRLLVRSSSSLSLLSFLAPKQQLIHLPSFCSDNAATYSTGRAAASFTSTAENLETKSERALIDEEEFMFDEITAPAKEKDRVKKKAFLRINTNMGSLNYE